jgi:hypothetical protein
MHGVRPFAKSLYVFAIVLLGTLSIFLSTLASQAQMAPRYNAHPRNWDRGRQTDHVGGGG